MSLLKSALAYLSVFFFCHSLSFADNPGIWQESKSTHFIVHYQNAGEDFVNRVVEKSEDCYNKIADDLGFRRFNFWLWDNRANIYVYDTARDYQAASGQPAWSGGAAIPRDKVIYTFLESKDFFSTVLPHEMGHLVFREFVGCDNSAVPVWLDEGVASYEMDKGMAAQSLLKSALSDGSFMDIAKLSRASPHTMGSNERVYLFYAESASIIEYLVKEYGTDNFVLFCQNLRDKRDLDRALVSSYPFNSMEEFDQGWQRYLKR